MVIALCDEILIDFTQGIQGECKNADTNLPSGSTTFCQHSESHKEPIFVRCSNLLNTIAKTRSRAQMVFLTLRGESIGGTLSIKPKARLFRIQSR